MRMTIVTRGPATGGRRTHVHALWIMPTPSLFAREVGALAHRRRRRRVGMAETRDAGSDREHAERETRGHDATPRGAHLRAIVPDSHDVLGRSHRASPS